MPERVIISIVALSALTLTLKRKQRTAFITALFTVSIFLSWISQPNILLVGVLLFGVSAFLTIVYGFTSQKLTFSAKVLIIIFGISAFLDSFFSVMHLPGDKVFKMILLIPIVGYLISFSKDFWKKPQFGFLTILATKFLIDHMKIWL